MVGSVPLGPADAGPVLLRWRPSPGQTGWMRGADNGSLPLWRRPSDGAYGGGGRSGFGGCAKEHA